MDNLTVMLLSDLTPFPSYSLNCSEWTMFVFMWVCLENAAPVGRLREVALHIGVELAGRIFSTRLLTCVWIIHQLKANVRTSEVYVFPSHLSPVC